MSNNNILWKGLVVLGTFMLLGFFVSYHLLLLSRDGPGENNVELFGQSGSQIQKRAIVRRNHRPDHITTTSSSSASSSLSSTTEATSTTITPSKPSTSSPETELPTTVSVTATSESELNSPEVTSSSDSEGSYSDEEGESSEESYDYGADYEEPCFIAPFKLNQVCDLSPELRDYAGVNVTLEEMAETIFVWELVETLIYDCEPGSWCLTDSSKQVVLFDKTNNQEYLNFCPLTDCLTEMTDDCLNEERKSILSSLMLLCEAKEANATDHCLTTMRKMVHVAMADDFRFDRDPGEGEYAECQMEMDEEFCSGKCEQTARHLTCLSAACEYRMLPVLDRYSSWQWFFSNNDSIDICNVTSENAECSVFKVSQSWLSRLLNKETFMDTVKSIDIRIISGIAGTLCLFTIFVVAAACMCARRKRMYLRYTRDGVEYKEVTPTEVTSDSDDEDIFTS